MPENEAEFVAQARNQRVGETVLRYDTIAIGLGAMDEDRGWFNSFASFGAAPEFRWFAGRSPNVGRSYTNQLASEFDYAMRLYRCGLEVIIPPAIDDIENSAASGNLGILMANLFKDFTSLKFKLQQTDNVLTLPVAHMPGATGSTSMFVDGAGSATVYPGQNGEVGLRGAWTFPDPIEVPSKSKIEVTGQMDNPLKSFLQGIPTLPSSKTMQIPDGAGGVTPVTMNDRVLLRFWFWGKRYVQIRGAATNG